VKLLSNRLPSVAGLCALVLVLWASATADAADPTSTADPAAEYSAHVRPILTQYCLSCHSREKRRGDLNLERFDTLDAARKDPRAWQEVWEKLEAGEMPPGKAPQPTPEERGRLTAWVRGFLVAEMKSHAGDPGRVVVRRLSNAEYDNTIRDLTSVDLRPTRDFPSDGAAGEGFTNAGDALVMSPTLLGKYLKAAKEIAAHAVLLPDGFRFSPSTARRDWTDEALAELRQAYRDSAPGPDDGRLDFTPYLAATVAHRDDLKSGKMTIDAAANQAKLNPKYLLMVWRALSDPEPSFPLDRIRARWLQTSPQDVEALASEVRAWQGLLWKFNKIGSYMNPVWQDAAMPTFIESQTLRFKPTLPPGRNEIVLYLAARDLGGLGDEGGLVVWRRPRFEGGRPQWTQRTPSYLLRDAAEFGGRLDAAYRTVFADTSDYLAAVEDAAHDSVLTPEILAKKRDLDVTVLKHWIAYLGRGPIPADSVLGRWRSAAADPKRRDELAMLAHQVRDLMTGERPADKNKPDWILYDSLASLDGPLFQGIDLVAWAKDAPAGAPAGGPHFGLGSSRFIRDPSGKTGDADSLTALADSVIEVRLPTAWLQNREFIVDAMMAPGTAGGPVRLETRLDPPDRNAPPAPGPLVASADLLRADSKQLAAGFDAFRRCFPAYRYYAKIIPDDEIINLRLFAREDDVLVGTFLDDAHKQRLDRLWTQLRFVSQQPLVEEKNYPQFLGFVSQDGPEPFKKFKATTEEGVHRRAAEFAKEQDAVAPKQLDALLDFAARAYRRPLEDKEKSDLHKLYDDLRQKEMTHEEAFRLVLARVLASPAFLYRIEQPAAGGGSQPISAWEQATRLSYFLWATTPDAQLRDAAAANKLADADDLATQAARMLKDPRTRGLATEFAAEWLQVRDFQNNKEKNEKLFPTFDDQLRQDLFEETILYFQDLFQNDRSVLEIVDSDHTFLNESLAKHYGIPNVSGPQWRRVDGVRQYGRGGVLTMGSVLATQSGASRTSPVLRGNWVVETLLGEKIPRPPPNVPKIPDDGTNADDLTVRQQVERHTRVAECAVCHQRIDPYGFALEKYDPIGRLRDRDLGGRPIDCTAKLRDGTQFDGVDGLRRYLLNQRRDDFLRHFCTKMLGYALGRSVTLADQPLIDDIVADLKANGCRVSAAIMAIIRSKQFRCHRERDAIGEE